MRQIRRGRRVALPLRAGPFMPLGVGRLDRLAHLPKRSGLRSSRFGRCAWLAPSRSRVCLVRYAPRADARTRPLAAKGAALRSSAVAPAAPQKSGVRSGLRPQRAYLSAGAQHGAAKNPRSDLRSLRRAQTCPLASGKGRTLGRAVSHGAPRPPCGLFVG